MTYMFRFFATIFLLLFLPFNAIATSYEEMTQQVEAFTQSEQSRFTPATMKKIVAYQGASMLAYEQQQSGFSTTGGTEQSQTLTNAINQTLQALEQAQNNASSFISSFPTLLALEIEANKAFVYHHKPQMMPEEIVNNHYNEAKKQMNIAIVNTEKGKLNQAKQAAKHAKIRYSKCIDASMTGLVEQTTRAVSQARSVGAKKYAPKTWEIADAELTLLEMYEEDLQLSQDEREGIQRPAKVGYALEMAVFAQKIAIQVNDWRRSNGSHEKLALASRQEHLNLAKALGLPLDYEKVGIDINAQTLVQHVQELKDTLANEREQHVLQITRMNTDFKGNLNQTLKQQRLKDQEAFQSKLSNIKSAFSTKLERETFETKRQKKVHDLFKKGETDIIASLDGSLVIRAKKIQFEPNSSKLGKQYFDFLSRIKEALMMYPDRQVRIEGHTDSIGDEKANRKVSLQRAEAVQEFLTVAGIDTGSIRCLGFGEVKPIASNMYQKGRTMNRRIDIIIEAPQHD